MRIFRILLVNILLFIALFALSEFVLFQKNLNKVPGIKYRIEKIPYRNLLSPERFRPVSGESFNKRPIILFGCSFAYGFSLKDEETIGYKLSQLSKRPVYNYAVQGKAFQNALFIIQKKLYDTHIKNPEYVIYIMMSDHIRRLYSNVCAEDFVGQPEYKLNKNGEMILVKDYFPLWRQFYSFYYFNNIIFQLWLKDDYVRHNKYVTAYFKSMKKYITLQYPDIKFVILMYGDKNNFGLDMSELENDGFIVLQTEEISGVNLLQRKYQKSDSDTHPVSEAWEIVAPALVDRLKL